ncbi:MAG TPA: ribonuclease III [Syntrophales bacterium]|nr:ribonuclease III [Syntrophales bacterium]
MSDERLTILRNLQQILAYTFNDINLLDNALIHRSFVNENPAQSYKDNERLEFLGDAVIGLCLSDMLIKKFPDYAEGQLSKLRAYVVNEHSLADLARELNIGDFLLLGKGEEGSGGRTKNSILSNAFEAVAAAIYLDRGFEEVSKFLNRIFAPLIEEGTKSITYRDYKTALQEICQNRFKETPKYTLIRETGPDHDKVFEISLVVAGSITATGMGKSKKEAEQQAAQKALEAIAKP